MPVKLYILAPVVVLTFVVPAAAVSESAYERHSQEPAITPDTKRDPGRDFLRPEFEHERQRGFDHDDRPRYREGLEQGREHATPRADPGLERAWEGLESERGRGLGREQPRGRRY